MIASAGAGPDDAALAATDAATISVSIIRIYISALFTTAAAPILRGVVSAALSSDNKEELRTNIGALPAGAAAAEAAAAPDAPPIIPPYERRLIYELISDFC